MKAVENCKKDIFRTFAQLITFLKKNFLVESEPIRYGSIKFVKKKNLFCTMHHSGKSKRHSWVHVSKFINQVSLDIGIQLGGEVALVSLNKTSSSQLSTFFKNFNFQLNFDLL